MTQETGCSTFSLSGKTVIVSGGCGLIGREVCDALASCGADVVVCDIRPQEEMEQFARAISDKHQATVFPVTLDISDRESINWALNQVKNKGLGCDVYVHLAAIDAKFDGSDASLEASSFEHFPEASWHKSVDVNINGTFHITQQIVREMLSRGGGNIITVASTYSLVAPDHSLYKEDGKDIQLFKPVDYVATKSMIPNFTRYLATLYGTRGIRANCIVPHGVYNNHSEEFERNFSRLTPLARMCKVEELRGPFIFLASDASSYMTGSTLVVDGGWTAW